MPYDFLNAYLPMTTTPKQTWIDDFKQIIEDEFYNSSDWFSIQEEYPFGSKSYKNVDARINYVVSNETGEKLSDDYKLLLFRDLDHVARLGSLFFFDDNYWICINTEKVKSLTTTLTVKRCNNTLRWIDTLGGIYSEYCTLGDNLIRENRDYSTTGSAVVNVSGNVEIICQFNPRTNKIKANQRFLFGNPNNWYAYKVFGGGVNNLNLMNTNDFFSAGLIRFTMGANQENYDSDDLENGICDVLQDVYVVSINETEINMNIGQHYELIPSVTFNGEIVNRNFTYVSNNEAVVEVTTAGIIVAKQSGIAKVYAYLENNDVVYDTVNVIVDVLPTENALVVYEPVINSMLQGTTETFTVYLEKNGVNQTDAFTFTVISTNVPAAKYIFTVLGDNSFKVENVKMYMTEPLIIRCTSGTYTKDISILLKGGW